MSLQVIGVGLGRTGTASLKVALEQLGFGGCYHFGEIGKNLSHAGQWLSAAGGNPDWERIFEGFGAAVDYPVCNFWEELAEAYPEAKIILTVRDANNWFDSVYTTIFSPMFIDWFKKGPSWEFFKNTVLRDFGEKVHERNFMVPYFEQRNASIKQTISDERLLVYEVKQGWEPLCNFLGLPIPDEPFPRVNSREETERLVKMVSSQPPEKALDQKFTSEAAKQLYVGSEDKGS